eukprot:gene11556-5492_t
MAHLHAYALRKVSQTMKRATDPELHSAALRENKQGENL